MNDILIGVCGLCNGSVIVKKGCNTAPQCQSCGAISDRVPVIQMQPGSGGTTNRGDDPL